MIKGVITGQDGSGLPLGGLETPCIMILQHMDNNMKEKAKQLLKKKGFSEAEIDEKAVGMKDSNPEKVAGKEKSNPKSRKRTTEDGERQGKKPNSEE